MASSKEYLDFILEQLSELEEITYRQMMGEYILYYRGKVIGGVYDDRFLVKQTKSALAMMPDAELEPWGQRTCYIADPEGNLIEIGSWNKPYEEKD